MIKATGTHRDGRPVLVIGLSAENVRRLQAGNPILFDARELGLDHWVTIIAGETEAALARDLGAPVDTAGAVQ